MDQDSADEVILVHGVWMFGMELRLLGKRLREQGFRVSYFHYMSIFGSPEEAATRLAERLNRSDSRVHIVAHSLGGVISLKALALREHALSGRMVFIGTPAQGAGAARRLQKLNVGWLLGKSLDVLVEPALLPGLLPETATIAGDRRFGIGQVFGGMETPHDGTVAVAETRLPGASDHCVVHGNHFGMLFMKEVAQRVAEFLRNGRFTLC